jgi:ribose 5-phosphate isomerase A
LGFQVPVEVTKFASELTAKKIESLGGVPKLRIKEGEIFITDNGNYIFDCDFGKIENPKELCELLNMIPGVVENGIFPDMADIIIIAHKDGKISEKNR